MQTKSDFVTHFMRRLRSARQKEMIENQTLCSACQEPVMDPSRQMIPGYNGAPTMRCVKCMKPFCRKPSCPMSVFECGCACLHCADCNVIRRDAAIVILWKYVMNVIELGVTNVKEHPNLANVVKRSMFVGTAGCRQKMRDAETTTCSVGNVISSAGVPFANLSYVFGV